MADRVTRKYSSFAGVDFSNKEVLLNRSPDSLNMWKDYSGSQGRYIQTRPDVELKATFTYKVYGIHFYKVGNINHMIVHSGTKLYKSTDEDYDTFTEITLPVTGLNPAKSSSFIFNNIFYFKDGINYLEYNGTTLSKVIGYIPTTTIAKFPSGAGTTFEDVNMLTGVRINTFVGDGTSTVYQLDATSIDTGYNEVVKVNDVVLPEIEGEVTNWTVNTTDGTVTFLAAPPAPNTEGSANVSIQFSKTISGYADRINKCTLLQVFDNRVFFSGNQDYPNTLFHSSLENPRYCSDLDYYNEGLDLQPVKSLVAGNNALWVMKEPAQANTAIYYHTPVIDSTYGKVYPSAHSSISTGCVGAGVNFNDDIAFFSERGMEAINGDINTEQVIAHRSSLVDNKLLSETSYKSMILSEWQGYLLVIIGNKIYLADSRQKFQNNDHLEYEWYYWELSETVTATETNKGTLYLGSYHTIESVTTYGVYTLTETDTTITSRWTTPMDDFGYANMRKTTNKRGGVADMYGDGLSLSVKVDEGAFQTPQSLTNTKDYVVYRVKQKKFKNIQLKFESTDPFGLVNATLEAYIGSYVKR